MEGMLDTAIRLPLVSLTLMRRPRMTSQSANANSPMPVMAETSDEEPRTSTWTTVSNT